MNQALEVGRGRCRWIVVRLLLLLAVVVAMHAPGGTGLSAQAARPSRIISLIPAVTEMLFAIGAGGAVVAVSSFDTFPPEAASRPRVGALVDPDFERILSLKPDLVVVYATQNELITRLERVRIPMFRYEHAGLADVTTTIATLGERIGRAAEAKQVVGQIDADLEAIRTSVSGRPRPRVLLLFGREPGTLRNLYASGGTGFLHDMIGVAGGTDVFADVNRQSVQMSVETLIARAPEVIVEGRPSTWTQMDSDREIGVFRTLSTVPAVRNNRIRIIADDRLFIPGPRIAQAARLLADAIQGR